MAVLPEGSQSEGGLQVSSHRQLVPSLCICKKFLWKPEGPVLATAPSKRAAGAEPPQQLW